MPTPYLLKSQAIALNWNNAANMKHLFWINWDLFGITYPEIDSEFVPYQNKELSGGRRNKKMGLPSCKWKLPFLSFDAADYLLTNYTTSLEDSKVTIRTIDLRTNEWYNYNALFIKPELHTVNRRTGYYDVVLDFTELELLP